MILKQNKFKNLHAPPDDITELDALQAAHEIDPRQKFYENIDNKLKEGFDKICAVMENTKETETMLKCMATMIKYKEHISKDPMFLFSSIRTMSKTEREIFSVIAKKYHLKKKITKEKDEKNLFK